MDVVRRILFLEAVHLVGISPSHLQGLLSLSDVDVILTSFWTSADFAMCPSALAYAIL